MVFTVLHPVNLAQIPHRLWMVVLTTVTFIPVIWLTARWAARGYAPWRGSARGSAPSHPKTAA